MLCKICKEDKCEGDFYKSNKSTCKVCVREKVKVNRLSKKEYYMEYDRNRPNQKERAKMDKERLLSLKETDPEKYHKQMLTRKEWVIRNPNKRKAQYKVSNAVRAGILEKKTSCENCGSEYRVQAHHESYEEDKWLDVVWLCNTCHKERHKMINEFRRNNLDVSPLIIPF